MKISSAVQLILWKSYEYAKKKHHEYLAPEHLLLALLDNAQIHKAIVELDAEAKVIRKNLEVYLDENMSKLLTGDPIQTVGFNQVILMASQQASSSGREELEPHHLLAAIIELQESHAAYYLLEQGLTKRDLMYELSHTSVEEGEEESIEIDNEKLDKQQVESEGQGETTSVSMLHKYTQNLVELAKKDTSDPLVGREEIMERTLQILCRRTKNNPIHVGEPGVGKTAIVLGLAKQIAEGKVPKVLKDAEIYSLDVGSLIAGTKYRGDFEERIKKVLDLLKHRPKPIVYIDEIHNIVGMGSLGNGSLDASNLLKPYLMEGKVRFIGATTFEEYKKYFEKDKALSRRFQTIEVKEPTVQETVAILKGLQANYEAYHGVTYTEDAIQSAAELSHKYMNDKFLPDKAIDLLDEAGATMHMQREEEQGKGVVDSAFIEEIISRICHIPKQTVEFNEVHALQSLEGELKEQIFGQDKAIEEVARCIKISRAGLSEDHKPVASMLFVGPTGVGKTEIARTLAKHLGVDLVRFDMSEYAEKHDASKLIGSPPGYVGYEEGGLLTDAIRKKPHCVLLLDEVEKAHPDILSVLLQVMDYATLTDNQGRKADFRNVILIMTSNAGAKNIGKSLVGFGKREVMGEAILEEIKKFFTPEFRNRLDQVVVFNGLDEEMSHRIAGKELEKFRDKLRAKKIELTFSEACISYVAEKGTSKEFGARQILRVISGELKPLLVDEILFGKLAQGGKATIDIKDNHFTIKAYKARAKAKK